MAGTGDSGRLHELCARMQGCISPYAGRVEYGNLRMRVSDWDCQREPSTNIALVYETPGGSTDQINITFHHRSGQFCLVDASRGEVSTEDLDAVVEAVMGRIRDIPERRRETLRAEIRRFVDGGNTNTAGLVMKINREMQSTFKGGTITHIELKDALTYAVQYMQGRNGGRPG